MTQRASSSRRWLLAVLLASSPVALSCRGKPAPGPEVPRPDSVLDPVVLYSAELCRMPRCRWHSTDRRWRLSDPVYLAIVDDDTLRSTISKGRPGTAMSAFAQKEGGMLTDEQIDAIVRGIRERWGKPDATGRRDDSSVCRQGAGQSAAGTKRCTRRSARPVMASDGKGGPKAGSVTNPAYLSLISDQGLRTIVITGRPDFGAPDWRGNVPGRPMTDQEISDVVAWLASQRPKQSAAIDSANPSSPGGRCQ